MAKIQPPESPTSGGATCLLCRSREVTILERLSVRDIVQCNCPEMASAAADVLQTRGSIAYCRCRECDLRFFFPPVSGSARYYDALQRQSWYYLEDKPEYQVAKRWIAKSDCVLEIGCGSGAFSQFVGNADYTGLEFSEQAMERATARGLRVFNRSIERHAREREEVYDVVCAFQVLEHVPKVHEFVSASVRALHLGGLLIYCVPSEDSYLSMAKNSALNMPPHHITRWTDQALKNIARLFPLELLSLEHELLAEFHKRDYASVLVLGMLERMSRKKRASRLVDLSLSHRIQRSCAWRLGKILANAMNNSILLPRGHSVTAVFRKTARRECFDAVVGSRAEATA